MHPSDIGPQRFAAGGQQRVVIVDALAVGEEHLAFAGIEQTHLAVHTLQMALAQIIRLQQGWNFIRRHFAGNDEFAQRGSIVGGVALLIDPHQAAAKTVAEQGGNGRAAGSACTDDHEATRITVPWGLGFR
ncbi:hypothetical protein D3C76_1338220 [compost metagenome]